MRRVIRFQTADGVDHATEHRARRHADERYGAALTDLAREAVRIDKFTKMRDFIEQHIDTFVALKALKDDMVLEQPDPDDMD